MKSEAALGADSAKTTQKRLTMMAVLDPGWWLVIACTILGAFGTIVAAIIKRPPDSAPAPPPSRNGSGGKRLDTSMIPGLSEVCQIQSGKIETLQTTCASMGTAMGDMEKKIDETNEAVKELKKDLDSGINRLAKEIRGEVR